MSGTRAEPYRDALDYVSGYLQSKDLFERQVSVKTQHIAEMTISKLNKQSRMPEKLFDLKNLQIPPNPELMEENRRTKSFKISPGI